MTEATDNSQPTLVPPVCPLGPFLLSNTPPCIVESVDSTNNSPLALEQGVARATVLMHRVMVERADRFRREMEGTGGENRWRERQEAVPGSWCECRNYKVTKNFRQGCIFFIYPL